MISTPTTFIVGAGGSEPYGLPLSKDLISRARGMPVEEPLRQLLYELQGVDPVNSWFKALKRSPVKSLDKFLQETQHVQDFGWIGRAVIAGLMGLGMQKPPAIQGPDWIEEILHSMAEGAKDLADFAAKNTGIQFVTFNFDTIIHERVTAHLRDRYFRCPGDHSQVAEKTCPVHHVHGKLSRPPKGVPFADPRGANAEWRDWLVDAAQQIRVVHDQEVDHAVVDRARAALTGAEVVVWLGLDYQPENLERLSVSHPHAQRSRGAFGSAFGIAPGRRDWIARKLPRIELGGATDKCVDVLHKFNWRL